MDRVVACVLEARYRGRLVKSSKELYKFHVANLQSVSDGLDHAFRSARNTIAHGNQIAVSTHVCLLSFLLGVWSEVRLLKLLYEPNGFSPAERKRILATTALERWKLAVEVAFRRHYNIPKAALRPPKLPSTAHHRLATLQETIQDDLSAIITMRNKLAHGQWKYPLNDRMDNVAQDQMNVLRGENVFSLRQKFNLLNILCQIVHDLVVSRPTFERDWDEHLRRFEQTRTNIERRNYDKWKEQIRARYNRGLEKLVRNRLQESSLLNGEGEQQERLHSVAQECFGTLSSGDPDLATRAKERVRRKIRERHAGTRAH